MNSGKTQDHLNPTAPGCIAALEAGSVPAVRTASASVRVLDAQVQEKAGGLMFRLAKSGALMGVTALVIVGGGVYAVASSTSHPKNISACVSHKGGTLYIAHKCAKHDKAIAWNKQGRRGARGPRESLARPGPRMRETRTRSRSIDSSSDSVAVQLTANGGHPLVVKFPASLQVTGVVRLRNNTGDGNTDQSGCTPQIARVGSAFADVGPQMLGLTNGFNSFNDEATISVLGELNVSPGSYDARIVCVRTFSSGTTDQNKFNGDAISVIAVAR